MTKVCKFTSSGKSAIQKKKLKKKVSDRSQRLSNQDIHDLQFRFYRFTAVFENSNFVIYGIASHFVAWILRRVCSNKEKIYQILRNKFKQF